MSRIISLKTALMFIIGSVLLLLVGSAYWGFIGAKTDSQMCRSSHDWPIPFQRLSDERHFPFLMFGRPISYWKERSDYAEYRAAAARFPDVTSCLFDSERQKKAPNLALFDWNKIKSNEEAEVCMFRVFSSIGGVEGASKWLESQGFKIWSIEKPTSIMEQRGQKDSDTQIYASWSIKECGERFRYRGILYEALANTFLHAHTFSVGARFGADGEPNMISVARVQK
jgi:hypothetical protein